MRLGQSDQVKCCGDWSGGQEAWGLGPGRLRFIRHRGAQGFPPSALALGLWQWRTHPRSPVCIHCRSLPWSFRMLSLALAQCGRLLAKMATEILPDPLFSHLCNVTLCVTCHQAVESLFSTPLNPDFIWSVGH